MRRAPVIAPPKGSPHALAWNMGTTTRIRSSEDSASASAMPVAMAWSAIERWEYRTPLGLPVVPLV